MKRRNTFRRALLGYAAFFLLTASVVTAAVLIYDALLDRYSGNDRTISLIMLFVCLALSLVCTFIDALRRRFSIDRAVEEILFATQTITSGNFKVRLKPRHSYAKYDDFDLIMVNLNQMCDALSRNEVLKSDFISNVSHEIKTPLSVLRTYAAALQDESLTSDRRAAYVKTLVQASDRMTNLVSNILQLNKMENQKLDPPLERVRLHDMLAETVFSYESILEKKQIELDCDLSEVAVLSSPSYLEIIWNNLFSNAVKFTPEGGKITLKLRREGDSAIVDVIDTGCGMSEETGKRIFDKFYQGDTSRSGEGNGLGLSLVKRAITVLGGEISVSSKLSQGTRFSVKLKGVLDEKR